MEDKIICFYTISCPPENVGGFGQQGWNIESPIGIFKLYNCNVYSICNSDNCYLVKDKYIKISKSEILNLKPDYFIARAYCDFGEFTKVFNNSKYSIYLYAALTPKNKDLNKFDKIIREEQFFKPLPDLNFFSKNDSYIKKYITCCGSFSPRKNQLKLIEEIDRNIIKNYTLVLCGKIKDEIYFNKVIDTLKRRKISFIIPFSNDNKIRKWYGNGYLKHDELASLYKQSICFILMSSCDGNPKSLLEAILTGVPFIISDEVKINNDYQKFGIQTNINNLNSSLNKILKKEVKFPKITEDFRSKHTMKYFAENVLCLK